MYVNVAHAACAMKELGVTAVELLPIHQRDPREDNYWGYMTLNFFSPEQSYAADDGNAVGEFRAMVKALHEAGIEVIIDVAYSHTTEAGENGPTYSFRGIDNSTYYLMEDDRRWYRNDTGCGNVLHTANAATRKLVLDSMRYRKAHPSLARSRFWREDVHWLGPNRELDRQHSPRALAFCLRGSSEEDDDLYVMINAGGEDLTFSIQQTAASGWQRVVDTGLDAPDDIVEPGREVTLESAAYTVKARSVVVFVAPSP